MRLYFDSNLYHYICETGEAEAIRRYLRGLGHVVVASEFNLLEAYANPNRRNIPDELRAIVTVASEYTDKPQAWLHTQEVLSEIRRCRPQWIQPIPFTKKARDFLKSHHKKWEEAMKLRMPPQFAVFAYRNDAESGMSATKQLQKELRSSALKGSSNWSLGQLRGSALQSIANLDLDDPETFWRIDCLLHWFNAIELRKQASRDYADYLCPFLKQHAFADDSYLTFWTEDVLGEHVTRNRIQGLVNFYQLSFKISHGNAYDQLHAGYLPDVDLLLTADRGFFGVLSKLLDHHKIDGAKPILIERQAPSLLDQIVMLM